MSLGIPNILTFLRIFITPVFPILYIGHSWLGISATLLPWILLFLLAISELSDIFDGYFARKYSQVTDLGKILDPMADSISHLSIFLTFTQGPIGLNILVVSIFFYRDSVISSLRTICALKGFALAARPSGKIRTIAQGVLAILLTALLIPHSWGYLSTSSLQEISFWLASLVAVYTIYSGVEYIYSNRLYIRKLLTVNAL